MNLSNTPGGERSTIWLDDDPHSEAADDRYHRSPDRYEERVAEEYAEPFPRRTRRPTPPGPKRSHDVSRPPLRAEPLLASFTDPKNAAIAGGLAGLFAGMVVTSLLFLVLFGGDGEGQTIAGTDGADAQALQPVAPAGVAPQAAQTPIPAQSVPAPLAPVDSTPSSLAPVDTAPAAAPIAPVPVPAGDDAAIQQEVLALTNAQRAQAGCPALTLDPLLIAAADGHSEDMARNDYFSHTDLAGNGPEGRVNAVGYQGRGWAENIAAGYPDPTAVVNGWMNSDGHRANILNCAYVHLGVGVAQGAGAVYWTQVFGAG